MDRRAALVGLDGGSLELLQGIAGQGLMPNLGSILEAGGFAHLRSTIPMYTLPCWTTCFTGVDPGGHEILYWRRGGPWLPWRDDAERPFAYLPFGVFPMIWEAVEALGGRAGCLDVPLGFPAQPTGAFFTAGFMAPPGSDRLCSPSGLLDRYPGWVPEVTKTVASQELRRDPDGRRAYLGELKRQTTLRRRFLQDHGAGLDLLCLVNVVPDRLSHLHWEPLVRLAETGEGEDELIACWREVDALLGDVRKLLGGEGTLIVVSDHGFAPGPSFNVARWLVDQGFSDAAVTWRVRAQELARRMVPRAARERLSAALRRRRSVPEYLPVSSRPTAPTIWPTTFDDRACYLYMNPERVDGSSRRALATAIVERVRAEHGMPRGVHPIEEALLGEEAFPGEHEAIMPDVVLVPAADWILVDDFAVSRLTLPPDAESRHHRLGVLLAEGPSIEPGEHGPSDMRDVFPTVLAALGHSSPPHLPGRRIEWIAPAPQAPAPRIRLRDLPEDAVVGAAEERELEEHLRALGYLE